MGAPFSDAVDPLKTGCPRLKQFYVQGLFSSKTMRYFCKELRWSIGLAIPFFHPDLLDYQGGPLPSLERLYPRAWPFDLSGGLILHCYTVHLMGKQELQSYLCPDREVGDLRYISWALPRLRLTQYYLDQASQAVLERLWRQDWAGRVPDCPDCDHEEWEDYTCWQWAMWTLREWAFLPRADFLFGFLTSVGLGRLRDAPRRRIGGIGS